MILRRLGVGSMQSLHSTSRILATSVPGRVVLGRQGMAEIVNLSSRDGLRAGVLQTSAFSGWRLPVPSHSTSRKLQTHSEQSHLTSSSVSIDRLPACCDRGFCLAERNLLSPIGSLAHLRSASVELTLKMAHLQLAPAHLKYARFIYADTMKTKPHS